MKKPKLSQYERDLKRRSSKFLSQSKSLFDSIKSLSFVPEEVLIILGSSSVHPKETYKLKIDQFKQIISTQTNTIPNINNNLLRKRISGILIQSLLQSEKFMTNTQQTQVPTSLHLLFRSDRNQNESNNLSSDNNLPTNFIPKQQFEPNYGQKKTTSKSQTSQLSCHFEITLNIELKQQTQTSNAQTQPSEKCWYQCTNSLKGFTLTTPENEEQNFDQD